MVDPLFVRMVFTEPHTFAACCGAFYYAGWPDKYYDYSKTYGPNGKVLPNADYLDLINSARDLTSDELREYMQFRLGVTVGEVETWEKKVAEAAPFGAQALHPRNQGALALAILNTRQRKVWHETFIEFGWRELACGFNYANDCHLYLITMRRPRYMSDEDWQALPFTKARKN